MFLLSLEIENYKSFWRKQKIEFSEGFNLLVGSNNSGKTSVLEALNAHRGLNNPHRSHKNLTTFGEEPNGFSEFRTTIQTDLAELRRLIGSNVYIPFAEPVPPSADVAYSRLVADSTLILDLHLSGSQASTASIESALGKSNPISNQSNSGFLALNVNFSSSSSPNPALQINNFVGASDKFDIVREKYLKQIYRFSALRRPSSECGTGGSRAGLDPEANFLPYCINHLQSNDAHGHKLLCKWVNRIFPSVAWVQAPPINNQFQLQCLPLPPDARRNDLAVPLSDMGTGIGNVIAMLYVVLTARFPQIIAIDEPNSFLHPRALRELLQILSREGAQHQYVLSAHSADVLTAVNPNLITLCEFDGASTSTKQVRGNELGHLREGLNDLGIRMTDLHGRDRVLWVEGQTEEIILPDLLRHFCPKIAPGVAVLRVEHTGTFEKKGVPTKEVVNLYTRLSHSSALVPPMVAVLLDSEARTLEECRRLEKETRGALRFLHEMMIENYMLHPGAIQSVLVDLGEDVSVSQVEEALKHALKAKEKEPLNGARILKNLFSLLSESRHEFKKTRDVPKITDWILRNEPNHLLTLGEFLQQLFTSSSP